MVTHFRGNVLKLVLIFLVSIVSFPLFAQYEKNYQPIQSKKQIPNEFKTQPLDLLNKSLSKNSILSESEALTYYSRIHFIKSQLFQGGQLYLENNLTLYLDTVVNKLLAAEPNLKKEVRFFLTRYTQANAFCFADGTVFVNIGLLANLESEAELAFILAHEIAHYAEQHSVKDLKRLANIGEEESFTNSGSEAFRSLKFSRESEFDADAWALQLIQSVGYEGQMAAKALSRLKESADTVSQFNLQTTFNSPLFTVDTAWYNKPSQRRIKNRMKMEDENALALGKLDDVFETHPDISKRIDAINLMLRNKSNYTIKYPTNSLNYSNIKLLATFEVIENNFREQDYYNVVLHSNLLLKKYPENIFLNNSITKSLYWLSYYKELSGDGELELSIKPQGVLNDYYTFCAMINKMDLRESKKLAYAFAITKYELFKEDESTLFYCAVTTDNYLGKNAAKNYYRDYMVKFPKGHFSNFVKNKLK